MINGAKRLDERPPWWLILIPATLVTMIFVVTALAFLVSTPSPTNWPALDDDTASSPASTPDIGFGLVR